MIWSAQLLTYSRGRSDWFMPFPGALAQTLIQGWDLACQFHFLMTITVTVRVPQSSICIYPTLLHGQDVTQGKFLSRAYRFEFRVFLLLHRLLNQGKIALFALLFTHIWWNNNWIHTFPNGYSAM